MDQELLIDAIYESAFLPEMWPAVLDGLAQTTEAKGGVLFAANAGYSNMRWTSSECLRESFSRFVSDGWLARDSRRDKILAKRHPGFLTDSDLFTPEEFATDETFHKFRKPNGLGWGAGIAVPLSTGDAIGIGVERSFTRGPMERPFVDKLDALRPHLARSALMSVRLQLERARSVAETLTALGLPAIVMDIGGRAMAANPLIEALSEPIRWRGKDMVSLADPVADTLFRNALATINQDQNSGPRSFAIRVAGESAHVAHVIPIRGGARDLFARSAAIFVLTPVTMPAAPPVELIQSLFDLSPAEARVARGLASGATIDQIAGQHDLSRNTIRTQLRGVLEKTGCSRQAELVSLLGGVSKPWG